MTITEFLEARIAEDEETASLLAKGDAGHSPRTQVYTGAEWVTTPLTTERLLAECKAKRAIVELHKGEKWTIPPVRRELDYWHSSISDNVEVRRGDRYVRTITNSEYLKEVGAVKQPPSSELIALAAVFADHPDYQQEWRIGESGGK